MSITLVNLDADAISVPMDEALRYMGAREGTPEIKAIAEDILAELRSAVSPRGCYTELPVSFCDGTVTVGEIVSDSKSLRNALAGCDSAIVFAATLGAGSERLMARYSKTAPSKAVIVSGLGSAMIESLCDCICDGIVAEYRKIGKCIKPRFSPGYGGFSLEAQLYIARILDTQRRIGLYFTDTLMMIPEKSVTAVMGIYSA